MYIFAGFDAGNSQVWNKQQSSYFDVKTGSRMIVNLSMTVPRDKHTRLVVQIVDDGYAVDQSYSKWIDT